MRRLAVPALSGLVALLALAPAAAAAGPHPPSVSFGHHVPAVYVDDTLCAFPVQVNGYDDYVETTFYDAQGNVTRTTFADHFRGTVTANGVTLNKSEDAVIIDNYQTGTETWLGLAERYAWPNGRVIAQDIGEITYDANGNVISEMGPHPISDGPGVTLVCNALTSG